MEKKYIKIKVITEAKKEKIIKKSSDKFEISVKESAEKNLANKKVLELVRKYFKVYNGSVRIVSGHHSPSKIISLDINK
jgi:uncharacterized protein YggU (UPF0235/DUF167 family)